jgi:hypothetical protein
MTSYSKGLANVVGQAADIGPFATDNMNAHFWVYIAQKSDFDLDLHRSSVNGDAPARKITEFFALDFFRRIHGRHLKNLPLEQRQNVL